MKRISTLIGAAGLAAIFAFGAGCGDSEGDKFAKLVDDMCACKDQKCLEGLQKKIEAMDTSKIKSSDLSKIASATEKMQKCITDAQKKVMESAKGK